MEHNYLFLVLLGLRKVYNSVERGRRIQTLEGYGTGPRLCDILVIFLVHQKVVPLQNGYHRPAFLATQGTTHGGIVSLTIFNIAIENAIRTGLALMVEYQEVDLSGVGYNVNRCLGNFLC